MVRPHSQSARRRYYRQLQADALAAAQAAVNAAQAPPQNPVPPQANPAQNVVANVVPGNPNLAGPSQPTPLINPNVVQNVVPGTSSHSLSNIQFQASPILSSPEAALHRKRPNPSQSLNKNTLMKRNKSGNFYQYVYVTCESTKVPELLRDLSTLATPTPTPSSKPAPAIPSTTQDQTTGGNPVKKIPALMDLKLSKPFPGVSFASSIVSARVAKANAAQAMLDKAASLPNKVTPPNKVPFQAKARVTIPNPTPLVTPLKLVIWGSSHFLDSRWMTAVIPQGIQFSEVLNNTKRGEGKLTQTKLIEILTYLEENPDPNQLFLFLYGGNHIRDAKRGEKEVDFVKKNFQTIIDRIKQMGARVVVCGPVPDPVYPNIDYRFLDLGHALSTLNFGPLGNYLELRPPVLNSQGDIREDCYLPHDIHLSKFGAQVVGSTINRLLKQIVRSAQIQIPIPQNPIQVPIPQVPIPILETEDYLAGVFLRVKGYQIPLPPQLLPLPDMDVDIPAETETNVAPDYPESDQNDMKTNDKNESIKSVEIVESDSESVVLDSEKFMPTFYPKNKLVPNPQDELAGPSTSSNVVQAAPTDSDSFLPVRASTPTIIPTPDLDMLNKTSDSVSSVASRVTLSGMNATNMLADHDQSMIAGLNETIVKRMKELQPLVEEEKLQTIPEEPELDDDVPENPEKESGSRDQNNDEAEWTIVSHKRSKK